MPPSVRNHLRDIGFEQSFGVVTAVDPMGVTQPPETNDELVARLRIRVAGIGAVQAEVDACGVAASHCERSIAIAIDLQSVIRIADEFRQLAIFWFDGSAFWIIPVRSDKAKQKLR